MIEIAVIVGLYALLLGAWLAEYLFAPRVFKLPSGVCY